MTMPGFTAEAALLDRSGRYRAISSFTPAATRRISPAINWGPFQSGLCSAQGYRQYSAILWNIPWGWSWERACQTTPGSPAGISPRPPNRCVNTGLNMWGQWDVPDTSCGTICRPTTVCRDDPASADPRCQICTRDNCDGTGSMWHTC